jgi:hypothetical protein
MKQETTFNQKTEHLILALNRPKEERKLETTSYDYTVDYVISLIEEGQIILEIPFQTDALWKTEKASLLIESLLMNFPIPAFYFSEQADGKWVVIDGTQRLSALFNFYQNTHKLKGMTILREFEDQCFNELPPQAKRLINLSIIRIVLIRYSSHPAMLHNVMMRLKT